MFLYFPLVNRLVKLRKRLLQNWKIFFSTNPFCVTLSNEQNYVSERIMQKNIFEMTQTLRPRSKISSAFAPRTVQCTAIFSLRRIPKDRTV